MQIFLWILFAIFLILLISPIDIMPAAEFDDVFYAIADIVIAWVISRIQTMKKVLNEKKKEETKTFDIEKKDD